MAESSQTLERGIMLLHLVNRDRPGGWSVTDLAAELGVGRPVVYRLLTALEKFDLVRRDEAGHVLLGIGVLRLSTGLHPTLSTLAAD
ncbi:MAG: helix-turn-helix domain-containing protein, partial [Antricoccus sp.]